MRMKKRILCQGEAKTLKNGRKRTKNGYCVNSPILNKSVPKKFFCTGVQFYFEISLFSFIHKLFEQNFYLHTTVYLVRIWTYKNADEKAHTFSRRSKNVKKRTKTYEKRILRKPTFSCFFRRLIFSGMLWDNTIWNLVTFQEGQYFRVSCNIFGSSNRRLKIIYYLRNNFTFFSFRSKLSFILSISWSSMSVLCTFQTLQ